MRSALSVDTFSSFCRHVQLFLLTHSTFLHPLMNRFAIRSTSGTSQPPNRVQTAGSNVWGQPGGLWAPASVASSQTCISSPNQGLNYAPTSLEDDLETSLSAAVSKRKSREESDEDYLKLSLHEIKRLKAEAAVYGSV